MEFWMGLYDNVSKSEPALHTAMILERRALERKKEGKNKPRSAAKIGLLK
jgi:hypothetical protein